MKLHLNLDLYLIIKALFTATANDVSRPTLNYIHYDKDKNTLIATNGHILRFQPVPDDFAEKSCCISKIPFNQSTKYIAEKYGKVAPFILDIDDEDINYPDVYKAIPDDQENKIHDNGHLISINPNAHEHLFNSFSKDQKKDIEAFTYVSTHSQISFIKIYCSCVKTGGHYLPKGYLIGCIMPIRIEFSELYEKTIYKKYKGYKIYLENARYNKVYSVFSENDLYLDYFNSYKEVKEFIDNRNEVPA